MAVWSVVRACLRARLRALRLVWCARPCAGHVAGGVFVHACLPQSTVRRALVLPRVRLRPLAVVLHRGRSSKATCLVVSWRACSFSRRAVSVRCAGAPCRAVQACVLVLATCAGGVVVVLVLLLLVLVVVVLVLLALVLVGGCDGDRGGGCVGGGVGVVGGVIGGGGVWYCMGMVVCRIHA